jgi:hypothetical protein
LDLTTGVSLVVATGAVFGIIFGYWGYSRGLKKDTYSEGALKGEQQADISYIKKRSDDILLEQKDTNRKLEGHSAQLTDHAVKIAKVTEVAASAHKRLDSLERGVRGD